MTDSISSQKIMDTLRRELASISATVDRQEASVVTEVGDGIAHVSGLKTAMAGELLQFTSSLTGRDVFGLAQNLDRDEVGAVLFGDVEDIKEGDEIPAEMVQTVEVGAYNLPSGIMTDKDDVIGKYATADLKVGDYILASKLSNEPAAENAYLYNLDGTKQAISVTIKSFATGLSGKLESGDIVSVLVADYKGMGETVIPPELQYVEVISVTASSGYDANTGEAVEDEKELPSTVTLLVTTEQAKVLAGLEQESELHLALVYRGAPENADEFIAAQDALIEELYAEPEAEEGAENAESAETEESEGADPAAESEAAGE